MKKDLGIKIFFIVLLLFSIYLIVTGIFTPGDTTAFNKNGEILEEDLQLSTYMLNMNIGEDYQVTATVLPDNATYKDVTWTSGNPNIVTVDNGLVKAINAGKTIIKVTTSKTYITKMINVTVNSNVIEITKINVSNPEVSLFVGDKEKINYTLEPSDANNTKLSFATSNKDIAGFDSTGNIVGVNEGSATITLKSSNGVTADIKVTVKQREIEVSSVKVDKKSITLTEGESKTITATVNPTNASNKTLTWSSSDNHIATVDNGKVTAIKEGTATIKVTSHNGKYKEVKVTVKPKEVIYPAITDDSKYHSGFSLVDSYKSDTFKFRIQTKNNADFVLIWVKNAYQQWNSSIPQFGKAYSGENHMSYTINTYGYQKKGLVATNGSFFWAGWGDTPGIPYIVNHGKVLRDIENKKYGTVYGCLGMTKEGELKTYSFGNDYSQNQAAKQEMIKDGVRTDFAFATMPISEGGKVSTSTDRNNRTVLCQINKNNFVIYSGGSLSFNQIGTELKNTFGCKVAYNLDGGGSRKLYYKTGSMSSAKKRFGGGRAVADMMYFAEQ